MEGNQYPFFLLPKMRIVMKKKGGRRLYEKVGKSMRWDTTKTELANSINDGNMFQEADIVNKETINTIFSEIMKVSDLINAFEKALN